jgi:DNA polymerase-3 subunit epsilon
MLILGKDYETTGLEPEKHSITEVGMVLWDTDLHAPIKVMGFLVDPGPNAVWDPVTLKITGLTPELCAKFGYPDERALKQVIAWHENAEVICAHNGTRFDRPFFEAWCRRLGFYVNPKLWIDTNTDIELGELDFKKSRKLTYMAADHQFLNPFPHRAVFDVMTMLKVLDNYDLERVLFLAKQPVVDVIANVSYDDRELAKARGYRWYPEQKLWVMTMKECFVEKEQAEAGFPIKVVSEVPGRK